MTANNYDKAERVRSFLEAQDHGRGAYTWSGRMSAEQQRQLFGEYLGRGRILIDWNRGTIEHIIKVCFGADSHTTKLIDLWA